MTATTEKTPAESANAERPGRLVVPQVGKGEKVSHDQVVSAEVLAEHDRLDDTRGERAAEILSDAGYDGSLTSAMLAKLQPLLDEPINPRHIVTTGPAERGKPITTTGIRSVQVQVDRLREVLGASHYRLLPHHTEQGDRCRMHVVIGNDLQWCALTPAGELQPYTVVPGSVANATGAVYAGVERAEVLAHADGWGGHQRGSAPADTWKGAETNAAKRVIARLGPGAHVYRLDFEDDPHQPEIASQRARAPRPPKPAAEQPAQADPQEALDLWLAKDDDLRELRHKAREALEHAEAPVQQQAREIVGADRAQLEQLIARVNSYLDGRGG